MAAFIGKNTATINLKKGNAMMKSIEVAKGKREEIHFLSQDLARKLIVPQSRKKEFNGLINQEALEQLQKNATKGSFEEKYGEKENKIKEREQLKKEQEERRAELEAWDIARKKNEKLSEMEEEVKQQMEYTRERASEMIRERNEEIKEINKLIIGAKVQAIRDAQIKEKINIKKKQAEAEEWSDQLMEQKRKEGVLEDCEKVMKQKEALHKAAKQLQKQIKENKEKKLIKEEEKIKEGEALLRKLKEDELWYFQKMEEKQLKKKILLEELAVENEEVRKRKQIMKEHDEKADKIIAEYQRIKAEQEEFKEAAEKEAKLKRELKLAEMGEQYKKAIEIQAEQESLRARRAQEEKEREFRQKEKAAVLKKKSEIEYLKRSRSEQIKQQEKMKQLRAAKEMEELEAMIMKLNEKNKEEERKNFFKKEINLKNLEDLKNQMKIKEIEKINEKKEFYKEGIHLQQEEKRREEMLKVLKTEKLNELRKYNIPENYIQYIKRKAHIEN